MKKNIKEFFEKIGISEDQFSGKEKVGGDPIKKDTVIDIKYYRLITGACEFGVKSFIEQNNLTKEKYKAEELLPILEKNNAYGLSKFKSLIAF